jgi:predicted nuclease with RNAse H fold
LVLGLDPTTSERQPSTFAVLDGSPSLVRRGQRHTNEEIMQEVRSSGATMVAIDSPLGLPLGLCCLKTTCACTQTLAVKGRQCERELAKQGIGCFFTTKRSIIKPMVYRMIMLRRTLEGQGFQVVEVYPFASKVRLFGRAPFKKQSPEGLRWLAERMASLVSGLEVCQVERDHNLGDAIVSAYTGWLHLHGKTEALGLAQEGQIVIPLSGAVDLGGQAGVWSHGGTSRAKP